jgi:DNA polymerase (family X)
MTNKEIAALLRNVAAAYSIKDEKKFRFQLLAYQNAADAIEGLSIQVKDLYKEGKIDQIPGVGATLKQRIEELLTTGEVKHFQEVLKGIPEPTFLLMRIPSIGPKKAYRLATEFKLSNNETAIQDLETVGLAGEIAKLDGFGEKSQADILRALEEYKKGFGKTTKMLLPYAGEIAEDMLSYLHEDKNVKEAMPLGSLRRRKPLVGDIDIAVVSKNPSFTIDHFTKYPRAGRIIEKGPSGSSLLTTGGAQIDLLVLEPDQWGSLLQHFTGSKDHNVHLREYALKKGLSLNEKGIKNVKSEKVERFSKEEDFYKALGMDWIPPEMREDTGEIELAIAHKLPRIIDVKDIKGDFHIHSSFPIEPSHDLGRNTIEEMILKAKELGYECLGFSEHNPSVSKHTDAQIVELIKRRNEEIDEQAKKHNFKVFKLMETDILPNGSLALPEEALEQLDGSIVSIHSVFKTEKDKMTERIIKGLSHPKAKILAHPTGRLLNERYGYDVDFEKLFEFAKKNNKALEINAFPNRLDLDGSIVRLAVDAGVKMTIDTDSHAAVQMDLMPYGVSQARRGWAKKSDIINALSYNEVENWFRS